MGIEEEHMPTFPPSEFKTARVLIPVSPAGMPCSAELWLSKDLAQKASSGRVDFVSTGAPQQIELILPMPTNTGNYNVLLDIYAGASLIGAYEGDELISIVPASNIEPALPPAGTGVPSAAELAAVKEVVRFRLQHLGWDVCGSVHYTDAMNEAVTVAMAPLQPLVDRFTAEIERVKEECLVANQAQIDSLTAEIDRLNALNDYLIWFVYRGGIPLPYHATAGGAVKQYNAATDSWITVGHITDWMTPEAKAAYYQYHCTYPSAADGQIYTTELTFTVMALGQQRGLLWQKCTIDLTLNLRRQRDSLEIRVWYCGYPLGY